jgi:hypothetical protein
VKRCYGNEFHQEHRSDCRPARPLCKWRRVKRDGVCQCGAYAFPHRLRSGACRLGAWQMLDQPMRQGIAL